MTNTKKYRIAIAKIKNRSVAPSDAKGIIPGQFFNSFHVQPRIKPVVNKNRFLLFVKPLDVRGQFLELAKKIASFADLHRKCAYFGVNAFIALRYDFLISSLFEYSRRLSSGIKKISFCSWSFISSSSFARRFKTAPSLLFLVIVAIQTNTILQNNKLSRVKINQSICG